jgi:hypothetical protein
LDIHATGEAIARSQLPGGAIGWPDGHIDPWDHVECAMALSVCGLRSSARRGYQWLRDTQRPDGSWPRSVSDSGAVLDHGAESHHAAYVAVGVWHEFLVSGDASFAVSMWPVVRKALSWTLDLRRPDGSIAWERDASGQPGSFALLSGCSSILQGLRCGVELSKLAGEPQPDWETAADALALTIRSAPSPVFADKSRFSMDWYYPVLGGALRGSAAVSRLRSSWDRFVVPGLGVRCVSDQPWVTIAETCELVLALDACGLRPRRSHCSRSSTGCASPTGRTGPAGSTSTRRISPTNAAHGPPPPSSSRPTPSATTAAAQPSSATRARYPREVAALLRTRSEPA